MILIFKIAFLYLITDMAMENSRDQRDALNTFVAGGLSGLVIKSGGINIILIKKIKKIKKEIGNQSYLEQL